MAKIVCVKTKVPTADIGDVVEVQEDWVELTGPGYEGYTIIHVEGKTKAELNTLFNAKIPEQRTAQKIPVAGEWTFLEEKQVWKNADGKWCNLVERPKYQITLEDLTEADKFNLASEVVEEVTKDAILDKVKEKICLNAKNLTEVEDLNK